MTVANIKPDMDEAKEEAAWAEWLKDRPKVIKDLGARFRPWKLYSMKSTGQRVVPTSFNENGTMTVAILGIYNFISMERAVFGIDPDDLEECDLPGPDEPVGVYLNDAEQLAMVNDKRAENGLPPLTEEELEQYKVGAGVTTCARDESDTSDAG